MVSMGWTFQIILLGQRKYKVQVLTRLIHLWHKMDDSFAVLTAPWVNWSDNLRKLPQCC